MTARIVLQDPNGPDDRNQAKYLIGIGMDRRAASGCCNTGGVLMSRHRYLTNEWQTFTMSSICPDMVEIEKPPIHGGTWPLTAYSIGPSSQIWSLIKGVFTENIIKEITEYFLKV